MIWSNMIWERRAKQRKAKLQQILIQWAKMVTNIKIHWMGCINIDLHKGVNIAVMFS